MKPRYWLDYVLPQALMRSWATAAGYSDEWPQEPRPVQERAQSAQQPAQLPREPGSAPFDDVQ
jgi:hypothetical protein